MAAAATLCTGTYGHDSDTFSLSCHGTFLLKGSDTKLASILLLPFPSDESAVAVLELDLAAGTIVSCGWDESVSPWGLASFIGEALLRYPKMRRPFTRSCENFEPLMTYLGLA